MRTLKVNFGRWNIINTLAAFSSFINHFLFPLSGHKELSTFNFNFLLVLNFSVSVLLSFSLLRLFFCRLRSHDVFLMLRGLADDLRGHKHAVTNMRHFIWQPARRSGTSGSCSDANIRVRIKDLPEQVWDECLRRDRTCLCRCVWRCVYLEQTPPCSWRGTKCVV